MIKIEFDEKTLEIAQNLFAECPEQVIAKAPSELRL